MGCRPSRPTATQPLAYDDRPAALRKLRSSRPARDGHLRHLSPNHSVAMPRNEKNPTTSVTVVTNTPDEIAGSAWKRWSTSGTRMPPSAPARRLQIMARPITRPRSSTLNHAAAATPVMTAKAKPLTKPTSISRRMMRAAPAGGVFRIEQAARQRDPLGWRELLENLGLLVLRQVREDGHCVVGIEFAYAFGHRLSGQLFEDLFADGVVDLGQRRKIEVVPHQLDQPGTQLRVERLDQIADVSLMQLAGQLAQRRGFPRGGRLRNALDEIGAPRPIPIAQHDRGWSHIFFFQHLVSGRN